MRTNQQLVEAHLPRCDWREFFKFTPTLEVPHIYQKDINDLDTYFQHFVPPGVCIKCGHQQGVDGHVDEFHGRGRFRFGLKYGEGQCITGGCHWPARALHFNIGPIRALEMILQYHPDVVTWDE